MSVCFLFLFLVFFFDLVIVRFAKSPGDQLVIGNDTGRRLYPSSSLLGDHKDNFIAALPVDKLIEKADQNYQPRVRNLQKFHCKIFYSFTEHKYEIVNWKHF